MTNLRPIEWITAVLSKLDKLLEYSVSHSPTSLTSNQDAMLTSELESHKTCLVKISQTNCPIVIGGLINSLQKLSAMRIYGARQEINLYASQIIVLNLLEKCISSKEFSLPNDSLIMKQLLTEICQFLNQPLNDKAVLTDLKASASKVLLCISQKNFLVVFNRISSRLHDLSLNSDDSSDLGDINLINHVEIDLGKIKILLEDIVQRFRYLKKSVQAVILTNLDKALWTWLSSYPDEIQLLYEPKLVEQRLNLDENSQQDIQLAIEKQKKLNDQISRCSEKLYDISVDGSRKKAVSLWPLHTLMLVLCPEILSQICSSEGNKSSKDLFEHLKKGLFSSGIRQENSVECYVRLLKTATCFSQQNDEFNPLLSIVKDILPDLQNVLFLPSSKYFMKTNDQSILINCFVSSFRLFPNKENLAKLCASSSSSVQLKMVLVQSLNCISTETCLDWWPNLDSLNKYGVDIRKIFQDCMIKHQASTHLSPRNRQSLLERMERKNVGMRRIETTYKDLLQVIVQLIQADPELFLRNSKTLSKEVIHSSLLEFFMSLASLYSVHASVNQQSLSTDSLEALLRLHDPVVIAQWNTEAVLYSFWIVSSNVLNSICEKLISQQLVSNVKITLNTLKWLHHVLINRVEFLSQNTGINCEQSKSDIVKKSKLKLEMLALEQLWNSNTDIVMVAISCLQCLIDEHDLRISTYGSLPLSSTLQITNEMYRELVECCTDVPIQEHAMSVFRKTTKFLPACLEAWEDTRGKWEEKTSQLLSFKQSKDDAVGEDVAKLEARKHINVVDVLDWVNMTGYLCSLGGVCMKSVQPISSSDLSLNGEVRTHLTPHRNQAMSSNNKNPASHTNVSRFISSLLNLLGSFNIKTLDINNSIRDLLAMSLHPSLYPTLFQQIKIFLTNNIFDTTGNQILLSRSNTQFVGYIVFILDKVFQHCSVNDAEYLAEESMEAMIIEIVRYIRHMGLNSPSIQLRIGFCRMIVSMMTRKHDFFFLSEIKFSNKVVDHITDWIMTPNTENLHFDDITLRDLDEHAVISVGVLLNGLPLHPYEGDGGNVPYAKSHLFLKYFTLFMKLLGKCTDQIHERKYQTSSVYDTSVERTDSLRKSLILAMSNLLSANIEYGLVHSMSLSYHDDIQTRSAFLEVLTKILQQGSHGFDSLGESVSAERFERLIELVTMMGDNGELPIANALANVVHTNYMDELARVFVTLFDAKHLLYQLLWNMFTKEVEEAKSVQTLFRGNSLASKIMTFCFKVYGASYLHNLVEPQVAWSLTPEISALQFDVDQKRLPPGVDILQCRLNLQRLTERFFTRIMTSTDKFPPQLKSVCHCLYQVVSQRFVESGNGAVASAIFLRFLNPAIATPYQGGLCDKPLPPNLARAFKFMCKIMQNIANHVEFTKEEHMKHFNEFVKARFDVCQQFFVQISTPECTSVDSVVNSTSYMNDTNVTALHRLLWNDQEKIGRFLAKSRSAKAVGRRPFDKMVTLLAYLGPPDYTRPVLETRYIIQNMMPCKFEELMTKRKATESEEFKLVKSLNIFYQFGRSKMGYPVFYYIARRYLRSDISEEILMFYILKALKPYAARKFDLIIDLTHVGARNGFRSQFLPKWLVVYPSNIYKNLDSVYIYNPNTWVREYVKYNETIFNEIACHQSLKFVEKLSEINNFIEKDHQNIPSATRDLDEDVSIYLNGYRSGHTKIHIKVGKKAVQISMADKVKFLGFEVILNNVYYSSEIESIELCDENNSFRFKENTNNSVMLFTHPESWKIAQEISHIRERWEIMEPQQNLSTRHKISAKDVPGTLLNMALLNLGCPKPLVRSCAYNLLCSLTSSFKLHLSGRLCESEGLCIPANNTLFIVSISKTLAKNERHLTLEFLEECIAGFQCSNNKLKTLCLEYMEPWLFNLPYFTQTNQVQRNKVKNVIKKLIDLTIQEKSFYPSIQTKIWANVGKMSLIIDIVLELFIEASEQGGLGSAKAEIMADTSVALSSSNMKLVSSKIISRLCCIIDKTCLRPTPSLEKHKHWDEIAILARYLLMLSFNNNLDVATHLPYLFHLVSLLLYTGPSSLKASVHGLVVNIIHSLLTCEHIAFTEETQQVLRLSLTEFCLPKFYCCFGISDVKYAADTAFKPQLSFSSSDSVKHDYYPIPASPNVNIDEDNGVINLSYLDTVTDALLEVMEACIKDIPNCAWLMEWQELSRKFALQYNPSLQPRALVVFGCINKTTTLSCLKQILNIMGKSLECNADPILLEACVLALTRLQLTVTMNSELHCIFFWLGICVMGLNEKHLYSSGLSLIEQNLHHLDLLGAFSHKSFDVALMNCITKVGTYFLNLQEALNISFHSDFHYAFITHLVKGFRHAENSVISCVIRVIEFVLELISRNKNCHKYEVNADSSPYLTALLCVSSEVRHHCPPIKKQISSGQNSSNASTSKLSNGHLSVNELEGKANSLNLDAQMSRNLHQPIPEETVVLPTSHNPTRRIRSVSTDDQITPHKPKLSNHADSDSSSSSYQMSRMKHSSLTLNFLFDEEVLDYNAQILLLSLLATQVRHSATHEEVKVLYEYLAEASIAFPKVFPIIHGLLDHKINHVLNHCEDSSILNNVQLIVHNALLFANTEEEQKRKQLNHLQRIGFGGMWRFAGPFAKVASLENASIICQLIDAMTDTFLGEVPDLNTVIMADLSCSDDDDEDGTDSLEISDEECHKNIEHIPGASGSFRNKGPKLTIKVPN